jgi:hypothetical protein
MVGKENELYVEVDRMKAEVDFRFTVAVPLAVAGVVVTRDASRREQELDA